jgi:hypothetical protein
MMCHYGTHAVQQTLVPYSITSSGRASRVGGTVRPNDLAVLRTIRDRGWMGGNHACCRTLHLLVIRAIRNANSVLASLLCVQWQSLSRQFVRNKEIAIEAEEELSLPTQFGEFRKPLISLFLRHPLSSDHERRHDAQ